MPPGRNSDQALFPIEGAHLWVLPVNDHIPVSGAQSNEREAAQFLAVTAVTLRGGARVGRSGLTSKTTKLKRVGNGGRRLTAGLEPNPHPANTTHPAPRLILPHLLPHPL